MCVYCEIVVEYRNSRVLKEKYNRVGSFIGTDNLQNAINHTIYPYRQYLIPSVAIAQQELVLVEGSCGDGQGQWW